MISTPDIEYKTEVTNFVNFQGPKTNFEGSPTYSGFFLFTQISGHVPIKILEVLNISKLQDNFCIYIDVNFICIWFIMFIPIKSNCPVTKFSQQKPCIFYAGDQWTLW